MITVVVETKQFIPECFTGTQPAAIVLSVTLPAPRSPHQQRATQTSPHSHNAAVSSSRQVAPIRPEVSLSLSLQNNSKNLGKNERRLRHKVTVLKFKLQIII